MPKRKRDTDNSSVKRYHVSRRNQHRARLLNQPQGELLFGERPQTLDRKPGTVIITEKVQGKMDGRPYYDLTLDITGERNPSTRRGRKFSLAGRTVTVWVGPNHPLRLYLSHTNRRLEVVHSRTPARDLTRSGRWMKAGVSLEEAFRRENLMSLMINKHLKEDEGHQNFREEQAKKAAKQCAKLEVLDKVMNESKTNLSRYVPK